MMWTAGHYLLGDLGEYWVVKLAADERRVCLNNDTIRLAVLDDWPLLTEWVQLNHTGTKSVLRSANLREVWRRRESDNAHLDLIHSW